MVESSSIHETATELTPTFSPLNPDATPVIVVDTASYRRTTTDYRRRARPYHCHVIDMFIAQ